MIEIGLVWVLIAGEVFLVMAVALVAMLFAGAARRRKDRQAAMQLVATIKENEAKRLAENQELLSGKYGYADESLEETARRMLRSEKRLYQRVINLYVKRDTAALRGLGVDVEAVTEPFRQLEVAAGGAAPVASGEAEDTGDVAALRLENESLKQELQITMETMSRMLSEYAGMFGSAGSGGEMPSEESTIHQMMVEQEPMETAAEESPFVDEDIEVGEAEEGAGGESLDAFEELEELADDFDEASRGASDSAQADETVVIAAQSGDVELADEDFDDLFGEADDVEGAAAERKEAVRDAEGHEMDDELADIWADALAEQDEDKDKK